MKKNHALAERGPMTLADRAANAVKTIRGNYLPEDTLWTVQTEQMQELSAAYTLLWLAINGDPYTLGFLAGQPSKRRFGVPSDLAIDILTLVVKPTDSYHRDVVKDMACVLRNALRRGISPDNFEGEAETDLSQCVTEDALSPNEPAR